ncbi:bifunctional diaminohydroxyphosphoribosylaminopyrimidine deaminase/5-amino-6-(5-phosphoribosylamino)uracil reductase RibD [Rhodothermus profundi]|uniref:Riboflavin biosynthesis protein RibD n=1 Tax=Rhodothermus profundi TaxID=633813 RepID=A0A1M6UCB5_9BACT|nr:bifunctional diaminohydroxyphosphoribosylaminopyrimidine deaminase/5-amino-6-(5-phosphoribosylamino)uracil reductase RibD [Rhodothermus profundi]SHK66817.1 diaminohydroxyphosphoribosylaminopyrimidine deaminase [Rhodothermus profundi]
MDAGWALAAGLHPGDLTARTEAERFMVRCLALAFRGAGRVSPNPMVGAVLVGADGRVLAEGWHDQYGGPHAERVAIETALHQHGPEALRQATLYVNLEPCAHYGKTPPCADFILAHRIPRVVVGMVDPFPKVAGQGIARLRAHGVQVEVGVLEAACRRFNEAFVHHVQTGRPLVTLKIAQTLDGFVATRTGHSRWISGEAARRLVHQWRAVLDGVLVGSGTAAADDPALTVRHVEGRQPIRIVLDRTGTLAPTLRLFTDAYAASTIAVVGPGVRPPYAASLEQAGGRLWEVPLHQGHLDLQALLERLGREGGREGRPLQSLLVEAGPRLATALLQQHLVDRFFVFISPRLFGSGVPVLCDLNVRAVPEGRRFDTYRWTAVGPDLLFMGYNWTL